MHEALDLSVVIPVYRSAKMLPELVSRLLTVLNQTGLAYEIVFVEDDGPDDSWAVLSRLQETHPDRIVAIQLMRNYGQHNAIMCGLRQSKGKWVVTMDDDLQHPPEEIPRLLEAMKSGDYDLIYGKPVDKKHSRFRNLGSDMINWFYRTTFRIPVRLTSFRIMRRQLLESVFSYNLNFTFLDGLFAWNTRRIGEIGVDHHPRQEGRSGYNLFKLITLSLNLFTNFSLVPLQFVSILGIASSLGGVLLSFYYLIQYLANRIIVPGYASLMIAILVLGGIQLLALGILGEYLGRLHLNVNRKPQYTVRNVLNRK